MPCLTQVEQNATAFDFHRVGPEILGKRRAECFSRADIELTLMQWTFDLASVKKAIAHPCLSMSTDVVGSKHLTINQVEGNFTSGCNDPNNVTIWDSFKRCNIDPFTIHKNT
ncbi:hypothetical protein RR51_27695 [Pseudomonas sp. C5pp]|nr:hypothetical protein RR51_27695 [Pseudomonas sp. C5pp]